jgi:hypothetical protein
MTATRIPSTSGLATTLPGEALAQGSLMVLCQEKVAKSEMLRHEIESDFFII